MISYALTTPSYSITAATYVNDTVDYYSSDVNYQTNDESYLYLLESSSYSIVPNLSWSTTGSTSILYSLSGYNGGAVPSWVALSTSTGAMTISTPTITSSSSDVSFYIVSQIGNPIKNFNKLITLRVNKCSSSNCQSWSTTDSTKWVSCKIGYELSSGSWVATSTSTTAITTTVQEVPESVETLGTSSKAVTGSTVVTAVVSNMLSSSSLSSIWSMLNQLQLLFLIPLTQIYLPYSVSEFILGNKFAFSPFEFIPVQKIEYLDDLIDWFNYGQSNSFVSKIGFKSISTFVNEWPFFTSFVIAFLIHLCLYLIVLLTKRWEETEYRWLITKVIWWIIRKVFEFFTFSYYVRIITEAFQHLLISSITEINNFDSHSTETFASLMVAFGVILFWTTFFLISLVLSLKTITEDDQNLGKFREYFSGVKNSKSSRIFTPLWIFRRIIFVTLLITLVSKAKIIVMSTVAFLQLLYTIYLIFQRPFDGAKENFIEIMNEIFFWVFIGWLFFFNSESRWTSSITNIYIWILSANNFMILVVVGGKLSN